MHCSVVGRMTCSQERGKIGVRLLLQLSKVYQEASVRVWEIGRMTGSQERGRGSCSCCPEFAEGKCKREGGGRGDDE